MSSKPEIYIVSDRKSRVNQVLRRLRGRSFRWLYLGQSVVRGINISEHIGDRGRRIQFSKNLQRASSKLRQPYIDYIGNLSQQYASPEWWSTSLAEKNPHTSHLLLHLSYISSCLDILAKGLGGAKVLLIVADSRALRCAFMSNLKRQGYQPRHSETWWDRIVDLGRDFGRLAVYKGYFILSELGRLFCARFLCRAHLSKALRQVLNSGKPLTLIHTFIDIRSFKPNTYEFYDHDFGELAKYLQREGEEVVRLAYISRVLPYRRVVDSLAKGDVPFLIPHAILKPWDILRVAITSMLHIPRRWTFPYMQGIDVSELIYADQQRDWWDPSVPKGQLFYNLVHRCKAQGLNIGKFIYNFENHAWERVLCMAMRRFYPKAKLVASQPAVVGEFQTNYFIANQERKLMPLPDRIVSSGAYSARILKQQYGDQMVVVGGALRQRHLEEDGERSHLSNSSPVVLVTPSLERKEAIELIWTAYQAFKNSDRIQVVLKCHPGMTYHRFPEALELDALPPNFTLSTQPLKMLLKYCNVLVYSSSGTCLEAAAIGVPCIRVESNLALYWDPLESVPQLRAIAYDSQELRERVLKLLDEEEENINENRMESRQALSDLLGPVDERTYKLFS